MTTISPSATADPASDAAPKRVRHVSTYTELAQQVKEAGLLRRAYTYYWSRILGAVAVFAGIWVAFAFLGDSWFQLLLAAGLGVVLTQISFLGHDSAHRQIFRSHHWNDWTSRVLSGLFAGLSHGWWVSKHSRHHANPNKEGSDPDIGPSAFAFTPAIAQARRGLAAKLTRWQGYFLPFVPFIGVALHIASIQRLVGKQPLKHRWTEIAFIAARLGGYITVLLLVLPPGKAAAFFAVQMLVFGLLLGSAFATNHVGMPIVPPDMKIDFLRRQVLMSRNISGGRFTTFAMGGLNYQIEHHLFPNMPRPNLRRARDLVRAHCVKHDVHYTETTFFGAFRAISRYLNDVGRMPDPFGCPLATQLR
ncbi:fatty acid desaturase family protein [Jiangella alkaliphila]|uniref:Fatty acid desaturase n=1 Tax=Jiangella alkaliphila TaxID=419479 RepID=A0A1H2KYD4_9ACTN|nr:acyl-CoA desaturase [Jiangella alkaliphila]SDU73484.1 Fatty acid desaturase [Jiangella alkaliphila]